MGYNNNYQNQNNQNQGNRGNGSTTFFLDLHRAIANNGNEEVRIASSGYLSNLSRGQGSTGTPVVNGKLAINNRGKAFNNVFGTNYPEDGAIWCKLAFWGNAADKVEERFNEIQATLPGRKSMKVWFTGKVTLSEWTDNNGQYHLEPQVTVYSWEAEQSSDSQGQQNGYQNQQGGGYQNNGNQRQQGGHQNQQNGGYQNNGNQRQQGGGYQNNGNQRQQGGNQNRQGGGFQNNGNQRQQGGNQNQQGGGYQNNGNQRQQGYQNNGYGYNQNMASTPGFTELDGDLSDGELPF